MSPQCEEYAFLSSKAFDTLVEGYLHSLHIRKRPKALIDQALANDCLMVLTNPENTSIYNPKFRWWVRKHFVFTILGELRILMDKKTGKPVCVREQLYDKICFFHALIGHGGRDKTFSAITRSYSKVPAELVSLFTKACTTCGTVRKHSRNKRIDTSLALTGPISINTQSMPMSMSMLSAVSTCSSSSNLSSMHDYDHMYSNHPSHHHNQPQHQHPHHHHHQHQHGHYQSSSSDSDHTVSPITPLESRSASSSALHDLHQKEINLMTQYPYQFMTGSGYQQQQQQQQQHPSPSQPQQHSQQQPQRSESQEAPHFPYFFQAQSLSSQEQASPTEMMMYRPQAMNDMVQQQQQSQTQYYQQQSQQSSQVQQQQHSTPLFGNYFGYMQRVPSFDAASSTSSSSAISQLATPKFDTPEQHYPSHHSSSGSHNSQQYSSVYPLEGVNEALIPSTAQLLAKSANFQQHHQQQQSQQQQQQQSLEVYSMVTAQSAIKLESDC